MVPGLEETDRAWQPVLFFRARSGASQEQRCDGSVSLPQNQGANESSGQQCPVAVQAEIIHPHWTAPRCVESHLLPWSEEAPCSALAGEQYERYLLGMVPRVLQSASAHQVVETRWFHLLL